MLRLFALMLVFASSMAQALEPPLAWTPGTKGVVRTLTHSGTADLLGRPKDYTLRFSTDPTEEAQVHGVVGFELHLKDVAGLAFPFDDFEGPDAPSYDKDSMTLTVQRADGSQAKWTYAPAGWIPELGDFAFGVTATTKIADSVPRKLLAALAHDADTLEIRIDAPNGTAQPLVLRVPIGGQRSDFKALLDNVADVPTTTKE